MKQVKYFNITWPGLVGIGFKKWYHGAWYQIGCVPAISEHFDEQPE